MRFLAAFIMLSLFLPSASAEAVTLKEAARRLQEKGAKSVSAAIFMGEPHILASMNEQGISLRLTQCFMEEKNNEQRCKVAVFSACQEISTINREQALEINNDYSLRFDARGNAHLEGAGVLGQKMCVHQRIDLQNEDIFDMADVFEWQLTMRDYFEFVDEKASNVRVQQMLGIVAQPNEEPAG